LTPKKLFRDGSSSPVKKTPCASTTDHDGALAEDEKFGLKESMANNTADVSVVQSFVDEGMQKMSPTQSRDGKANGFAVRVTVTSIASMRNMAAVSPENITRGFDGRILSNSLRTSEESRLHNSRVSDASHGSTDPWYMAPFSGWTCSKTIDTTDFDTTVLDTTGFNTTDLDTTDFDTTSLDTSGSYNMEGRPAFDNSLLSHDTAEETHFAATMDNKINQHTSTDFRNDLDLTVLNKTMADFREVKRMVFEQMKDQSNGELHVNAAMKWFFSPAKSEKPTEVSHESSPESCESSELDPIKKSYIF
jgi:hypothetical protein